MPFDQRLDGSVLPVPSILPQLGAMLLHLSKCFAGPLGNQATFLLGDGGKDVQLEIPRIRYFGDDQSDTPFHDRRDAADLAGEAVELGVVDRLPQFLTLAILARLNLDILGKHIVTVRQKSIDQRLPQQGPNPTCAAAPSIP